MKERVLILESKDLPSLGPIRCMAGLRAATHEGRIWVRGINTHEQPAPEILQLPAVQTYLLDEQERLFPPKGQTPVSELPALSWLALTEFIPVTLPVSAMPGVLAEKHPLRLRPSGSIQQGDALLTDLRIWKSYAADAPLVRLQQLRFAVSAQDKVLILGTPLPPLPGKEYVTQDHMLLPCGFDFDPPVAGRLAARQLNPLEDFLLLFDTDGSWEQIPYDHFVPATRSAVRLTKAMMKDE